MNKFGVSTHLYHEQRLQQGHLIEIAAHGFEAVELFATRSHFDYHDPAAIQSLGAWLAGSALSLHSIHAPITDVFANGRSQRTFSTAARDPQARSETLREVAAALNVARIIPCHFLVVHLGVPDPSRDAPSTGLRVVPSSSRDENSRDAALRSVEEILALTEPLGVRVALEVMGNGLSTPEDLIDILERNFEDADLGICMDVGHAHMLGDTAEAIEMTSEYLVTTHIHDNRRQADDHLVPFQGSIDWPSAVMALEKIGYDGVLMYEVKAAQSTGVVLERAVRARQRLESLMVDSVQLSPDSFS